MKNLDLKEIKKSLPLHKHHHHNHQEAGVVLGAVFAVWVVYKLTVLSFAVLALGASMYKHNKSFRKEVDAKRHELEGKAEDVTDSAKDLVEDVKDNVKTGVRKAKAQVDAVG